MQHAFIVSGHVKEKTSPGLCSPSTLIEDKFFFHIIQLKACIRCANQILPQDMVFPYSMCRGVDSPATIYAIRCAWLYDGILPYTSYQTVQDTFCNKHKKALCVRTCVTSSLVHRKQSCLSRHYSYGLDALSLTGCCLASQLAQHEAADHFMVVALLP